MDWQAVASYGLGNPTPGGHVAQILWFENYQPADAAEVGGKNASLGTLTGAGEMIPGHALSENG